MPRNPIPWLPQGHLGEVELSTDLAPTVEALVDTHGMSIRAAVEMLRQVLAAYPE